MKWASALSEKPAFDNAVAEVLQRVEAQLEGVQPDLAFAFASPDYGPPLSELPRWVRKRWPGTQLIGCSGAGVIGGGHEVAGRCAVSLTAASMPGVAVKAFHYDTQDLPAGAGWGAWEQQVGVPRTELPHFLLLADPFTCDVEQLVDGLDQTYPGTRKVGGLASGGRGPGAHRLFLGDETWRSGAVGVALSGRIKMDAIVAQGCRAIGTPLIVTACKDHVILELNGKKPLEVLQELVQSLTEGDRALATHSLFLGVEMKQEVVEYRPSDLLVRNLAGVDARTGALAVGTRLKQLQVVQFLLRDAKAATADLEAHLKRFRPGAVSPAGALLFSCIGRGEALFGQADHDPTMLRDHVGPVPVGGFFCNGEIGPVGTKTFLHGYTSAFALISAADGTP